MPKLGGAPTLPLFMTARRLQFRIQTRDKVKRFWAGIFAFTPIILLWVNQTVSSTKILYQIQKLEEEVKREHNRSIELKILRDRMTSLEFVEWTAKNKLGFVVPKAEEIVMISVPEK